MNLLKIILLFHLFLLQSFCTDFKINKINITDHESILVNNKLNITVIFENGLMQNLENWNKVFPSLNNVNLLLYNRYGYENSKTVEIDRDGIHIVKELKELLEKSNLKPPYILVGHSLGGLYMQYFANAYPNEVKALILVDSTHPTQFINETSYDNWPIFVKFGFDLLSNETQKNELYNINKTGEDVLALKPYDGIVRILSSLESQNDNSTFGKIAHEKRKDFKNLYLNSKQIWLDCGHNIPVEKPEVVIETINQAIKEISRNEL